MKTFKILFAAILVFTGLLNAQVPSQSAGITTPAQAKPKKEKLSPEQRAEKHTASITSISGLNDDQRAKVKQIFLERAQQHDANHAQHKGDKVAIKAANKEANKAAHEKLKGVLTAEQMQKWHQHVKASKGKTGNSSTNQPSSEELLDAIDK